MSEERAQGVFPADMVPGHRGDDVDARNIVLTTVAFFAAIALVLVFVAGVFVWYRARERKNETAPPPMAERPHLPPAPALQADPAGDMAELHATQQKLLESYGWIDRDAGVVRIPIDEAMRLAVSSQRVKQDASAATQPAGGEGAK